MKKIYAFNIKRALLSLSFVLFTLFSFSNTYYFSNAGSDTNSGLSASLPWKSISKLNSVTLTAGDNLLFNRGDVFYGQILPQRSTINYGAYGTGSNPVISGFEVISNWTNQGGGIYSATTTAFNSLNMVTVDGLNTGKGRYPNADFNRFESHSGLTSITDNELTSASSWVGAEVVVKTSRFSLESKVVLTHSGGTLTFAATSHEILDGYGYFFQNDMKTLDRMGEWYCKDGKIYMYFGSENPANHVVKVSVIDDVFKVQNKTDVTISNLTIEGGNNSCVYANINCTNFVLDGCELRFSGNYGTTNTASGFKVMNSTISECNNIGIYTYSPSATISGNIINRIGLLEGMGAYCGYIAISVNGDNSTTEKNTITNVGYDGIILRGNNSIVRSNYIDTYCCILDDGGGIYTSNNTYTGRIIDHNICVNGIGNYAGSTNYSNALPSTTLYAHGIYLDEKASNITVSNNTTTKNSDSGIFLHSATSINVTGNTSFDNAKNQLLFSHNTVAPNMANINVTGNILFSKETTQKCFYFTSNYDDLAFGNASGNVYARPIDDNQVISIDTYNTSAILYSLDAWKTLSGLDATSTKSPALISNSSECQFEYNKSLSAKTIALSSPMVCSKGIIHPTSITLEPFTSIVLLKSGTIEPVLNSEYKSICEGTSYNGWVSSGIYERTLVASTGGDSIVTTYLTVNQKYNTTEDITISQGEAYNGWIATGQYSRTLSSVFGCDSIVTTNLTVEDVTIKQGEITPSHFTTVWQGENGQNHMNFTIVSAINEDLPMSTDDEIAVFSGSNCVGAAKLSQAILNSDNSTFISFTASQNYATNNGYIDNDTIIFKIWDSANQREMIANVVTYKQDLSTWLTTGKFTPGATAVVEISSFVDLTQTINLLKGYNLVSTYLTPSDPNVSKVMKSICDSGNLTKMQDEAGNSFEYWGSFGGWINNIGNFEKTEGYKIRVNSDCSMQVTGRVVALPLNISLKTGWNFISFPSTEIVNGMAVIQSLIDQNKLTKVQDEVGNSIENFKNYGGWKNNIGNFLPGKAYKVCVSSDAVLTIQANYPKSGVLLAQTEKSEYFSTNVEGNGSNHMNINIFGIQESAISVGDELAAFDGDVCVGVLKITERNILDGYACLIASNETGGVNLDGFKEGNAIKIYSWNQNTGDESIVETEIIKGQLTFEKSASVQVKLKSLKTGIKNIDDVAKIDLYPNPSNGKVTVRFSELPAAGSTIEIFDVSGRKITSRLISNDSEVFNLDNQLSGLYIVKTNIGSTQIIHKLIIKK